jgi:hypothetical protein
MFIFTILGISIILIVLVDAFETIVLPRRVSRRFRLARGFYRITWLPWVKIATYFPSETFRQIYLGIYGPLSLIVLLVFWAIGLILGFALFNFGMDIDIIVSHGPKDFITYLYASGTTFFTLGLGDVYPAKHIGRISFVTEAGTGFTFLAIIIGYLPTLYQAFSHRETQVTMLDARAGSPPSASLLLSVYKGKDMENSLTQLLENWEVWCSELLEVQLSYPILAYYRSQHERQSWLSTLSLILDISSLILVGVNNVSKRQAQFTFAVARHAVVDLTQIFRLTPHFPQKERLPAKDLKQLREILKKRGIILAHGKKEDEYFEELRNLYEPYLQVLSEYFHMPLSTFVLSADNEEEWKSTPWKRITKNIGRNRPNGNI